MKQEFSNWLHEFQFGFALGARRPQDGNTLYAPQIFRYAHPPGSVLAGDFSAAKYFSSAVSFRTMKYPVGVVRRKFDGAVSFVQKNVRQEKQVACLAVNLPLFVQ